MTPQPFNEVLSSWRSKLGLSQEAAARQLGVTYAAYRKWEAKARTPDDFKRRALEAAMAEITKATGIKPE